MRAVRRFCLAAAILLSPVAAAPALAQIAAAPVVVIVDVQQILRDSLVAKNVQAQMDRRTQRYTQEVTQEENELRQTQNELERQRTALTPDAFNAKMRAFEQRYDALDNSVQVTRQALQKSYNDAMTKVENTALQIISNIAAERKANLVLTKAAVLFEAPGMDITQEVIRRLDQKLPQVTLAAPPELNLPPSAPAAGAPAQK